MIIMLYDTSSIIFLSTLSLRRATRVVDGSKSSIEISIHALLAESDALGLLGWLRVLISIHALLAESDEHAYQLVLWVLRFLSTLSLRRATTTHALTASTAPHFYPRSPCGERPP